MRLTRACRGAGQGAGQGTGQGWGLGPGQEVGQDTRLIFKQQVEQVTRRRNYETLDRKAHVEEFVGPRFGLNTTERAGCAAGQGVGRVSVSRARLLSPAPLTGNVSHQLDTLFRRAATEVSAAHCSSVMSGRASV